MHHYLTLDMHSFPPNFGSQYASGVDGFLVPPFGLSGVEAGFNQSPSLPVSTERCVSRQAARRFFGIVYPSFDSAENVRYVARMPACTAPLLRVGEPNRLRSLLAPARSVLTDSAFWCNWLDEVIDSASLKPPTFFLTSQIKGLRKEPFLCLQLRSQVGWMPAALITFRHLSISL